MHSAPTDLALVRVWDNLEINKYGCFFGPLYNRKQVVQGLFYFATNTHSLGLKSMKNLIFLFLNSSINPVIYNDSYLKFNMSNFRKRSYRVNLLLSKCIIS